MGVLPREWLAALDSPASRCKGSAKIRRSRICRPGGRPIPTGQRFSSSRGSGTASGVAGTPRQRVGRPAVSQSIADSSCTTSSWAWPAVSVSVRRSSSAVPTCDTVSIWTPPAASTEGNSPKLHGAAANRRQVNPCGCHSGAFRFATGSRRPRRRPATGIGALAAFCLLCLIRPQRREGTTCPRVPRDRRPRSVSRESATRPAATDSGPPEAPDAAPCASPTCRCPPTTSAQTFRPAPAPAIRPRLAPAAALVRRVGRDIFGTLFGTPRLRAA